MVTSMILGVAVLGLTSTYTNSQTGMVSSRSRSSAHELARQRIELLGTQNVQQLPDCAGATGCMANNAYSAELAAAGTFQCTQYVDDMETLDPDLASAIGRYRVDTVVVDHPDSARQPNARVVTVSVCWSDAVGKVHEIQARRTFVPGV